MQHYKSKIEVQYSYFIEFYLDMIPVSISCIISDTCLHQNPA
jgi:hypothetical protein